MEAPRQVKGALALLWLSVIGGVVAMAVDLHPAELSDAIGWSGPWFTLAFWGSMLISYGVIALLIMAMARRKNWARITYLVVAIVGTAGALYPWDGVNAAYWEGFTLSTIVFMAIDAVALYWLFSGAGSEWYGRRREGAL